MKLSKHMTNLEVAELFRQIAAVYTLQNQQPFRIQAYVSVASSIEQLSTPLREVWQAGKLDDIPGVGEKFTAYLNELFKTGRITRLEKILASEPAGMYPLLDVPGIGPKTAHKLANVFHLTSEKQALQKVKALAEAGKIQTLMGFSEVSEAKILQALQRHANQSSHRMLLSEAAQLAEDVLSYIRLSPLAEKAEALGSLRRRVPTVGDVDIAVATQKPAEFMQYLLQFPHIRKVLSAGEKTVMFVHSSGRQIDVKTQNPTQWGSMLQHYTGSKLHNIHLRTYAMSKDLSLSENGIKKGEKELFFANEKSFYEYLDLRYIPPELREDEGEIEAAKAKRLPKLVQLLDIKGDFHIHTNVNFPSSHDSGQSSVAEILTKAQELGYAYVGFSDHQPKQSGLNAKERFLAVQQRTTAIHKAVQTFQKQSPRPVPQVFIGLEIDISADGNLALENESIELLDYVVASIHATFDLAREQQTQRILNALAHPKVKIFGHPTARKLELRPEIECDWAAVFAFAAKEKKLLEINASPDRTDLPAALIRQAISMGVRLVIDSDAHTAEGLGVMKYGVWNAQRGWAEAKNIANTQKAWQWS